MDIYEYMRLCEEQGMDGQEALNQWYIDCEQRRRDFMDDYYTRPDVCAGMAQQDTIDMYRRER